MSYFVRFLLLCCTVALAIPTYANALNERDAVVSRQTGKLQIRVHYPITGNARVDADVADWAHQAVDTFQNTYGEEPDLGVPYELETTYSTTRSTPSVLSIVWKTASYTGGAHGNLEITTTTYDMKSGALIDLYDVFENLDTALDVMSRYCTKALTKSLGDMYNDDMLRSGTAPEAENFSSFALTPEGIRIFFQPYQVAPWAAGSQVVDIPLDALADAAPFALGQITPFRQAYPFLTPHLIVLKQGPRHVFQARAAPRKGGLIFSCSPKEKGGNIAPAFL